jgi:hypothetical protein
MHVTVAIYQRKQQNANTEVLIRDWGWRRWRWRKRYGASSTLRNLWWTESREDTLWLSDDACLARLPPQDLLVERLLPTRKLCDLECGRYNIIHCTRVSLNCNRRTKSLIAYAEEN